MADELREILKGKHLSDDESIKVIKEMLDSNRSFVLIPCKTCPEVLIMQFSADDSIFHNLMMIQSALVVHEDMHIGYKT